MRHSFFVWLAAAAFALALVCAVLGLTALNNPYELNTSEGDALIFLRVEYAPDITCAAVTWKVEHIRAVYLNGKGRVGEGQEQVCGQQPVLQVEFQDRSLHEYTPYPQAAQRWLLLALALALSGFGLRSPLLMSSGEIPERSRLITMLVVVAALFILALALPNSLLFQTWVASLPLAEDGTPSLGHIFLIGLATTVVYWVFTPPRLRPGLVAVMSLLIFALEGASPELMTLVALLTLLVHITVSGGQAEDATPQKPSALTIVSLLFLGVLLLLLLLGGRLPLLSPLWWIGLGGCTFLAALLYRLWSGQVTQAAVMLLPGQAFTWPVWASAAVTLFLMGAVVLTTFISRPTLPLFVTDKLTLIPLMAISLIAVALVRRQAALVLRRRLAYGLIAYMLILFVLLKSTVGASLGIVGWIGFSYITFRLLHVLFEFLNNRDTGGASVAEMLAYVLFFPAILVGPIDRLPRFLTDLRDQSRQFEWSRTAEGIRRIMVGGIKKFFLADLLLSPLIMAKGLPLEAGVSFAWLQLYATAFYIYFDFSGFTDIAIGMGLLLGYKLPENFTAPYRKNNLAQFWQSWHITLSSWLRTYIFLPLSRSLLRSRMGRRPTLVVFCTQMVTMLLIGLWHGITFNFALWGLWHGFGLFVQKVFADRTRRWQMQVKKRAWVAHVMNIGGLLLTFHFVALGWALFMLKTPADSLTFVLHLLGWR